MSLNPILAKAYKLKDPTIESLASDSQFAVTKLVSKAICLEEYNKELKAENDELKYGPAEADANKPMMDKTGWDELVNETVLLKSFVLDVQTDSKLQHLIHILIGYREFIITFGEDTQPYSPGSARDISWRHGRELAAADLKKRELNRKRNTGTSPASSA